MLQGLHPQGTEDPQGGGPHQKDLGHQEAKCQQRDLLEGNVVQERDHHPQDKESVLLVDHIHQGEYLDHPLLLIRGPLLVQVEAICHPLRVAVGLVLDEGVPVQEG